MKSIIKILSVGLLLGCVPSAAADTLAHWTFGEHGLTDISGNNVALTANNVEFGETGYATLNGTNAWLETTETLDLTSYSQLTVECWMRPETPIAEKADFGPLFLHYAYNGQNVPGSFVTYFSTTERSLRSQLLDGEKWTITIKQAASGLPYAEGGWHHVALVMDITGNETRSGKSKLYVDGVRLAGHDSTMTATIHKFLNLKFVIGGGGDYVPGRFFRGQIDDVRISSGCLTPDQFLKFPTIGRKQSADKPALAFWPFGKDELADTTGNGFDLAPTVSTSGDFSFGDGAVHFPGTRGLYISKAFPAHAFSQSGLTYEFFFRTTSELSDIAVLLESSGNYGNGPGRFHLRLNENRSKVYALLRTTGGWNSSISGANDAKANDGEWHHAALVYDPKSAGAERFRVYQDGVLLAKYPGEESDNLTHLDGACSLFFGCRGGNEYFHVGDMDDVRVMPWALKPEEFMKMRTIREPLAHWKFDTAETALTDLTGNGHTLVNQNGVAFQDGYAYFNGANANLITAEPIDLSQEKQLTVEGRFWFDDTQKLNVLFDTDDTASPGGFVVYGNNGSLMSQFRVASGVWQQYIQGGFQSYGGGWHHVAFVLNLDNRNATQSRLWVDGRQTSCSASTHNTSLTTLLNTKLSFGGGGAYGRWAWGDANYHSSFKGRISEVVVTAAELKPSTFHLLKQPDAQVTVLKPAAKAPAPVTVDLTGARDVTVECYAKFDASPAGELFAFDSAEGVDFSLAVAENMLMGTVVPKTGGANTEAAAIPTDGAWHHLALVVDDRAQGSDRVRLYVDGVRSDTHLAWVNWTEAFSSGTLTVGTGFAGKISTVRVSKGALAPADFLDKRQVPGLTILIR